MASYEILCYFTIEQMLSWCHMPKLRLLRVERLTNIWGNWRNKICNAAFTAYCSSIYRQKYLNHYKLHYISSFVQPLITQHTQLWHVTPALHDIIIWITADASVVQLVKPLPPNLSAFFCHEFNSGLRQAGVPYFQKCINFGRLWGNNL